MAKVKICGITNIEDASFASAAGADVLGFIFARQSPRCLKQRDALRIISRLDPFVLKAGVFVDQAKHKVLRCAQKLSLDVLQFHGAESAAYCQFFRPRFKVIKVFFPEEQLFKRALRHYKVDAYMFDVSLRRKQAGKKSLSKAAHKEIRALIKAGRRVIISGGLTPENINRLKPLRPYAVDVAGGVERSPGRKSHRRLELFIKKAKKL